MAVLVVPAKLESNFFLGNGGKGQLIQKAFEFTSDKVDNLYSWDESSRTFQFSFQECGVAYGEKDASQYLVEQSFVCRKQPDFKLHFNAVQENRWALNFVGTVTVTHDNGSKYKIYVPGTRTYDPAGKTGDPHASERIGPSCSRTQTAITLAQLFAALHGADKDSLKDLQEHLRPLIKRYHGRETLFDWMFLQLQETVYFCKEATPYPEFVKRCIMSKRLVLEDARQHTREYLFSYNLGSPTLPQLYYKKVSQKDAVEELFNNKQLEQFKKLADI